MTVLLGGEQHYSCPNCTSTLKLPAPPDKPVLHPCRGLKGLLAPMIVDGTRCKVEAVERGDYLGEDAGNVRLDGEGRPVMSVVTTRDDGTDVAVFAPIATAEGRI